MGAMDEATEFFASDSADSEIIIYIFCLMCMISIAQDGCVSSYSKYHRISSFCSVEFGSRGQGKFLEILCRSPEA